MGHIGLFVTVAAEGVDEGILGNGAGLYLPGSECFSVSRWLRFSSLMLQGCGKREGMCSSVVLGNARANGRVLAEFDVCEM